MRSRNLKSAEWRRGQRHARTAQIEKSARAQLGQRLSHLADLKLFAARIVGIRHIPKNGFPQRFSTAHSKENRK
jgi:hypothetical protein